MGRTSKINEESLYSAIAQIMVTKGSVSMQDVVEITGVSVGSLYHRYNSREKLLESVWIDALSAFQNLFLATAPATSDDLGETLALVTPKFCRKNHHRALVISCCQKSQFLLDDGVSELVDACEKLNREMDKVIKAYAIESSISVDSCYLGIVHYPLAVVRFYLPKRVPKHADQHVSAAFHAAVGIK